jgi:predicted phage terminase large subunit-like protein
MPPRHGKSELISHYFPAWYLGRNPDNQLILCCYESSFAQSWGAKARDLLLEYGPDWFDGVRVNPFASSSDHWEILKRKGVMNTAGIGGPITGKGADVLIIDDPIKNPEEAASATMREKIWEWWEGAAMPRLEPDGAVIVVMTRWHKDDLVGRLKKEGGWKVLSFPAIAVEADILQRNPGDALWPSRFSLARLEAIRQGISPYYWTALYQQSPMERGGNIFKQEWWHYYGVAPEFFRIIQSWDTAFKKGATNDFSVCTTWGENQHGYYLLDLWRGRVEFPELKRTFYALFNRYKPQAVLVEDAASGQSLIQEIRRPSENLPAIPILPIRPETDKVARAYAVTPIIEAGLVHLMDSAPWLIDLYTETGGFPTAEHDDVVDSITQALSYLTRSNINTTAGQQNYQEVAIPQFYSNGLPSF